jgi:predicted DCC family thiol-disulfide oxidoreductase YuxK
MKTLENNILIYDCECPMCNLYSGAFIKTGMLDQNGRMPYDQMTDTVKGLIDLDRSRNEIALVNTEKKEVLYGLDSLLHILGNRFPFIHTIFRFPPLYWLMKRCYSFISYNRKVIAPAKVLDAQGSCTPDYHIKYRWSFIILSSLLIAWILNLYFRNVSFIKDQPHGFLIELAFITNQLIIQGLLVAGIRENRAVHYLGHNSTVSLIGALLLLPAIWFSKLLLGISEYLYIAYFAIPVIVMFWQHVRRVRILALPYGITVSWILYRMILFFLYIAE